jgi:4-aminobutyrate aminotransferase
LIGITGRLRRNAQEALCERAEQLGNRLRQRLEGLRDQVSQIADVRGPGLMVAAEFNKRGERVPDAAFTDAVRVKALEKGLILLTCGVYGNVVRFLPPLTVSDEVFTEALDILEDALVTVSKGVA